MRPGLGPCLLLGLLILLPVSQGQDIDSNRANVVKAAALRELPRFVKWPEAAFRDTTSAIVIGVLGHDPFGQILDTVMADETVRGRRLEIRRFGDGAAAQLPIDALHACHVLFVSESEESGLEEILESLRDAHVLTVSDLDRFANRGGIVELAIEGGRIALKVNRASADRARIKLKASLLQMAEIVPTDERDRRDDGVRR